MYSEIGDSIHMGHYIEFKGEPFYETGSGLIKGDSIIYHVDVIRPIAAWGPRRRHSLPKTKCRQKYT